MVNKIIADYLKTNKRLVVPQFGAFIHKEGEGAIVFVPFLKKDDGVLTGLLQAQYGMNAADAQAVIDEYIAEVRESISVRGAFIIEGVGQLMLDSNGVCYLNSKTEATVPVQASPAPAVREALVSPSAPVAQPQPEHRPVQPVVPPAQPRMQEPVRQSQPAEVPSRQQPAQAYGQRPVQQSGPGMPPPAQRQEGRPMQQPPRQAPAPQSEQPFRTPPYPQQAQQPFQPPRPQSPRPQQPQRPGPGRPSGRPQGQRVARTKTDGFIIIAILAAIVALAAIIFGMSFNRGEELESIILPAQADTSVVQESNR